MFERIAVGSVNFPSADGEEYYEPEVQPYMAVLERLQERLVPFTTSEGVTLELFVEVAASVPVVEAPREPTDVDPPCGHMLRGIRKPYCARCQRAAAGVPLPPATHELKAETDRVALREKMGKEGVAAVAPTQAVAGWTHACPKSTGTVLLPIWSNCTNCSAHSPGVAGTRRRLTSDGNGGFCIVTEPAPGVATTHAYSPTRHANGYWCPDCVGPASAATPGVIPCDGGPQR